MSVSSNDDFEEIINSPEGTIFVQLAHFPQASDDFICTSQFLQASKSIVVLIDIFGTFYTVLKSDVQGNIDKLSSVYHSNVADHSNLLHMLKKELPSGGVATEALLWLKRGFHFFYEFFDLLRQDYEHNRMKEDLTDHINTAYESHLQMHHSWFVKQLFKVMCGAAPEHSPLIKQLALGRPNEEAVVYKSLDNFLFGLDNNLSVLQRFYKIHNLDPTG